VNRLLEQFTQAKKLMKQMTKGKGKFRGMPGMGM
jgi:signal recognition particle GTPase